MSLLLCDVIGLMDQMYDPAWADSWDAVGLVCGDPEREVAKILFAVDPAPEAVEEAIAWDADLLVVHHPLLLKPVHGVGATTPKGRVIHDLIRSGIALFTAHTNADGAPGGVNESLARALGIVAPEVIAAEPSAPLDKVVTFVPHESAEQMRTVLAAAGAGAIGDYDSCTFTTVGEGRFRPMAGARPSIGRIGEVEVVAESRVEAVFSRHLRHHVIEAMKSAHPYEEPAYDVLELADVPSGRGHGRIGALAQPMTLGEYATAVGAALPATAHGIRVAGDPDQEIRTVAVTCGSGDFLLDTVLGTDADVYVTSDLRHHRAGEFLEHRGPALIDVAHWAAEWTWLPVVEQRVLESLSERGDTVETRVSTTVTDPWTFRVDYEGVHR